MFRLRSGVGVGVSEVKYQLLVSSDIWNGATCSTSRIRDSEVPKKVSLSQIIEV